jgi:hypothetical protein
LPEESALSVLVGIALEGEYAGVLGIPPPGSGVKELEALQLRTIAATVFENYLLANDVIRLSLVEELKPQPGYEIGEFA